MRVLDDALALPLTVYRR